MRKQLFWPDMHPGSAWGFVVTSSCFLCLGPALCRRTFPECLVIIVVVIIIIRSLFCPRIWLETELATPRCYEEHRSTATIAARGQPLAWRCSRANHGDAQRVVCFRGSRSLRAADAELTSEWHPNLGSSRPALQFTRQQCKTS